MNIEPNLELETESQIPAKCICYDPLSSSEGKCVIDQLIVSRFGGCENPEECSSFNNYKNIQKEN